MRSIVIFRFFSHLSLLFVYQCITFLPLIFRFSFYNKEIAGQLHISEKTVEGQITIALKKIRIHLGDSYSYLW